MITITDIIEFLGTYAFAISGIRLAAAKNFDWFGAYVIGLVTAIGGGTLRDMMLGVSPFWMSNSVYLIETGAAFLTVLIFSKWLVKNDTSIFLFDAIGLGLFTLVGLEKTLSMGFPLWTAIIMGTITGAAGGIFRDVLINEVPLVFRKEIYALACVIGGLIYGLCDYLGLNVHASQTACLFSVLAIRILAVTRHLALPVLKAIDFDIPEIAEDKEEKKEEKAEDETDSSL